MDSLYSDKKMGLTYEDGQPFFRLFAPRAKWVKLVVFDDHKSDTGRQFTMHKDRNGVWKLGGLGSLQGKYYGYKVWGPTGEGENFDSTVVIADPYSFAVVARNYYTHPAKSLIISPNFMPNDTIKGVSVDPKDLILYEMHVRDMTAHSSSGLNEKLRGTYSGLVNSDQRGGLPYIKKLGVNAVELLPVQEFGNIEINYMDSSLAVYNTWNPYERNHWGYMTSYFFAPESYYATGGTMEPGKYNGADGRQIKEFKNMVNKFHSNGIAVIMDVVYNHVSQYDYNCFKYIDKFYYFRLNDNCQYTTVSGCGNDFATERPMARKLIVESVRHWMTTYNIDGFRFDLALMLDWKTLDKIREEALKINPDVLLIAEPWGGGYGPDKFSDHDWAAWNDRFRNGVKGQNPYDGLGFIFGRWQGDNSSQTMRNYITGSTRENGGQFVKVEHSVNYLESHDDNTLGDFIRIALHEVSEDLIVNDRLNNVRLSEKQLKLNKLAALILLTSRGSVMIHEGQEFARSKVIAPAPVKDITPGKIDHNSYEKDDETNWLNFDHAVINGELWEYYRNLIELRKRHEAFRLAGLKDVEFLPQNDEFLLAYKLNYAGNYYVAVYNGNPDNNVEVKLPDGNWRILVDGFAVYNEDMFTNVSEKITVPASTGVILMKR